MSSLIVYNNTFILIIIFLLLVETKKQQWKCQTWSCATIVKRGFTGMKGLNIIINANYK